MDRRWRLSGKAYSHHRHEHSLPSHNAPASCANPGSFSGSVSPRHGSVPSTLSTDSETRSRAECDTHRPLAHPDECAHLMSHALLFTETGIHVRAIATQHCIRRDKVLQDRDVVMWWTPPLSAVSFILRLTAFNLGEHNMSTIKVVGIDIAKSVFQVCVWLMVLLPGIVKYLARNCSTRCASFHRKHWLLWKLAQHLTSGDEHWYRWAMT